MRVFISYSHDSPEHQHRVLMLAQRLRHDGVDAILDLYLETPAEGWPRWMVNQIKEADRVLLVCTPTYAERFEGAAAPPGGKGAKWEGAVITQILFEAEHANEKFIPVVFNVGEVAAIPLILKGSTRYVLNDQYEKLYRVLTGQSELLVPPLGRVRQLPPRRVRSDLSRGMARTSPKFKSAEFERLSLELQRQLERYAELRQRGEDSGDSLSVILSLKRRMRSGPSLEVGDILADRYLLVERRGYGGFATVWRAEDIQDHEVVALKILHGQHHEDQSRVERFFRGARKMAQLDHPGVVRVLTPECADEGFKFFVMQYFPGGDLRTAILNGKLGRLQAFHGLLTVGEALHHAHVRGLIHRDVKPANILLDAVGELKLTDFDLVHALDTTGGTRTAAMMGTYLYAAPECLTDGSRVGVSADIYSLAMTMMFSLYGRDLPPILVRNPAEFIQQLSVETAFRGPLERASAFKPEDRFSSMREFLDALRKSRKTKTEEEVKVRSTRRSVELRLNPRYRFATFVEGPSNALALASARAVANKSIGRYSPLVIYGDSGSGKTHLLHAIAAEISSSRPQSRVLYVNADDLVFEISHAIRNDGLSELREKYRARDVIMIDDLQALKERRQEQDELLFSLGFDSAGKQVVFTASENPRQMDGLNNRLRSFLDGAMVADIQPPDLNIKLAILLRKAEAEDIELRQDVAEYIARHVRSNLRELEGLYARVTAFASLTGRELNLALAQETLADLFPEERQPRGADVIEVVARHYGLTDAQVKGTQNRQFAFQRQIAMYLCKRLTDLSYPEIGKLFGDKHHSTVMYSVQKIEQVVASDQELRRVIKMLHEMVYSK